MADNVPVNLVPNKVHHCRLIGRVEADTFVCVVFPTKVERVKRELVGGTVIPPAGKVARLEMVQPQFAMIEHSLH